MFPHLPSPSTFLRSLELKMSKELKVLHPYTLHIIYTYTSILIFHLWVKLPKKLGEFEHQATTNVFAAGCKQMAKYFCKMCSVVCKIKKGRSALE